MTEKLRNDVIEAARHVDAGPTAQQALRDALRALDSLPSPVSDGAAVREVLEAARMVDSDYADGRDMFASTDRLSRALVKMDSKMLDAALYASTTVVHEGELASPVSVPEGDAREIARALVDIVRLQNWENGGVLALDVEDAVTQIAAALLSAESRARREAISDCREWVERYVAVGMAYEMEKAVLSLSSPEEG